jgi:hypothetical protein
MKPDWIAFKKMFKVPIPVEDYADYYIDQLARSPEFAHLPALLAEFVAWQARINDDPKVARKASSERLIEFLKGTTAFTKLQLDEALFREVGYNYPMQRVDRRKEFFDGRWIVSIDLVQANFYTFWSLGLEHDTWDDLCDSQEIDPLLAKSKTFRQMVFGHLCPKRNQRVQSWRIAHIAKYLEDVEADLTVVYQEHDELVLTADRAFEEIVGWAQEAVTELGEIPTKITLMQHQQIGKGRYLVANYDPNTIKQKYLSLFGVPGNRYMLEFKKYVLCEEPDVHDRLFLVDDHLAKWMD